MDEVGPEIDLSALRGKPTGGKHQNHEQVQHRHGAIEAGTAVFNHVSPHPEQSGHEDGKSRDDGDDAGHLTRYAAVLGDRAQSPAVLRSADVEAEDGVLEDVADEHDDADDPGDPRERLALLVAALWLGQEALFVGVVALSDEQLQLLGCLVVVDRDEPDDAKDAEIVESVHRAQRGQRPARHVRGGVVVHCAYDDALCDRKQRAQQDQPEHVADELDGQLSLSVPVQRVPSGAGRRCTDEDAEARSEVHFGAV